MSDSKRARIAGKNDEKTLIEQLIQALGNMFDSIFSSNTVEYKHNAEAQKATNDAIKKMEELGKDYLDNGQYAEAYIVSRQAEIIKAAHETAIGLDKKEHGREHWKISERDTFIAVAKENSIRKLEQLDNNNTSKIAFNDYRGTADPVELSSIFDNVKESTGEIYNEFFDKKTIKIMKDLTAMDLNELKDINHMPTSTPEQLSKINPTNNIDSQRESGLDSKNEQNVEGPTDNSMSSGPGR